MKSPDFLDRHSLHSILFTPGELKQVLSTYSAGVLRKNWRDYAILSNSDQTQFAVVERGSGDQPRVLYALTKLKQGKKDPLFKVFDGEKPILQTTSFLEALQCFRHAGQKKPELKVMK